MGPTPLSPESFPLDVLGWILVAVICVVIEILSVGFFALFLAIGAAITAVIAYFTHNLLIQAAAFAATSILTLAVARPLVQKALNLKDKPARLSNADALINEPVLALQDVTRYQGKVRVIHTGEEWTAYLHTDSHSECIPAGQEGVVICVDGAKLAIKETVK